MDRDTARVLRERCDDATLYRIATALLGSKRQPGRPKGPGSAPVRQRLAALLLQNIGGSFNILKGVVLDEVAGLAPWAREAGYGPQTKGNARRHLSRGITIKELRKASDLAPRDKDGIPAIDLYLNHNATISEIEALHGTDEAPLHQRHSEISAHRSGVASPEKADRIAAVARLLADVDAMLDRPMAEAVETLADLALHWNKTRQRVQKLDH